MATDLDLLAALRDRLQTMAGPDTWADWVEKRITGGTGFMWRNALVCGVQGDELLVRLDRATGAALLGQDGAHPMTMGGRSSTGWILVPMPPARRTELLSRWVALAMEHSATRPPGRPRPNTR